MSPRTRTAARRRHLSLTSTIVVIVTVGLVGPAHATPRGKRPPRPVGAAEALNEFQSRLVTGNAPAANAAVVNRPDPMCRPHAETLNYHGGALVKNPDVFILFWGNEWNTDAEHIAAKTALVSMSQNLGTSEFACAWREYAVPGLPLGPGTYNGSFVITSAPPSPLSDAAIQQAIKDEITAGDAPARTNDRVYVMVPKKGVPVVASDGSTGCGGFNFIFCGYHDSFGTAAAPFRYEVLPFPCNSGGGTCFVDVAEDPGTALQVVGSHELTELTTDPDSPAIGNGGWFSDHSGSENADICGGSACTDTVTVGAQTYTVNPAWSNLAKGCITGVACTAPALECTDGAPGICVSGTGKSHACELEWLADPNLTQIARTQLPGRTISCADGQLFCDADGAQDGQCTFHVAACLNSQDPRLACVPTSISSLKLTSPAPISTDPTNILNRATVLGALQNADPGSTGTVSGAGITYSPAAVTQNACTSYFNIVVPSGKQRRIAVTLHTGAGVARNRLSLKCSATLP